MKRLFAILMVVLLQNETCVAQQLFATPTNTPIIEYPYDAVELPGNRYALSIAKRTGIMPNDHSFMELVITDSVGTIERYVLYPEDSSVNIYPRDIFYQDGKLYSVALVDSTTQNPAHLHLSVWDTSLNLLLEKVHTVCDSGWYVFESYAEMYSDKIFSLECRAEIGDDVGGKTHPFLSIYDLDGELLKRENIDSGFFVLLAGGDDYTVLPDDLTISTEGDIFFSFLGGRIGGSPSGIIQAFMARLDSSLNLSSVVEFGCWDVTCDTSFAGYSGKKIFATAGSTVYGTFVTILWNTNVILNGIAKLSLPEGSFGTALTMKNLSIIPDNTNSTSIVKILGRKAISVLGSNVYSLGMDFHSFSPAGNHLIISKADTNGQVVWTKYLPSDGRPFEPRFILATSDGGCLVAASVLDGLTNPYDHYIFKLDGNGHFTSVQRLEQENERVVKVFPNPASSVLNFELDKEGEYSIVISDMNGRSVLREMVNEISQAIDVGQLAEGVYQYAVYEKGDILDSGLWLRK